MIKKKYKKKFVERLEKYYDELSALYLNLYHDEKALEAFLDMMHEYYTDRPVSLKRLDNKRANNPGWYKGNDMLGMLMYTQCFAENLQGVKSHLDYIEETGVNYLHLMPLLESPKGRDDGGYAVSNFRKVQPELGTIEDLCELSNECHRRGLSVCLDFVMNHTSEDHEWAMKAKQGDKTYQDYYFFYDNWDEPNEYERYVPQVFPTTAPGNFTFNEQTQKVVMTTFYPYQWDLNYANPTVMNEMCANMLYLCNCGIDIIRLDAVPYIWKKLGTNCRNLPEVHDLVRIMRIVSEVVCPGTLLLGEVVMEPSKVVPYFGSVEKPECHMLYNVTTMASMWHTVATRDVRLLKHQMEKVFELPHQYTFLNYLRCHDDIGWGLEYDFLRQFGMEEVPHKKYLNDYLTGHFENSQARGELYNDDPRLGDARLVGMTASLVGMEPALEENNAEKLEKALNFDMMLHAFLYTQSGIPVLYSGDEIGQLNDYSYHNDPLKKQDSRYLHRGNLDWNKVELRHMEGYEAKLYEMITKLAKIRSEYVVFESHADTWVLETYNDHILALGRYYKGQKLLAFFNFSDHNEVAYVNEPENYKDLLTDTYVSAKNLVIKAQSFKWLYYDFNKE